MGKFARRSIEVGLGAEPHQVGVARLVLGQQDDAVGIGLAQRLAEGGLLVEPGQADLAADDRLDALAGQRLGALQRAERSEEHTSELQSLMRISYAVFCLKKKKHTERET